MRKLTLLLLASAVATGSYAQTPVKVNSGLLTKISATWCGPCGSWGWDAATELKAATHDKAFYMGIFPSTNGSWNNSEFLNETAKAFAADPVFMGSGYPSFAANAVDKSDQNTSGGSVNVAATKADVISAINDFATAPVVAGTGYTVEKTGNTIKVKSKTKFWDAATGDYYIAAYMVEDGAMNRQNGQTSSSDANDKTAHTNVLRGSMTGNTMADARGVLLVSNPTKDQVIDKEFTYTVSSSTWDMAKMKVQMIIWKKDGATYTYVNGNNVNEWVTSVDDVKGVNNLNLYPNPATDHVDVNFVMTQGTDVTINVTDAMGRTVYTSGSINVNAGETVYTIPTANFATGTYNVSVISDNGVSTKRVAIAK